MGGGLKASQKKFFLEKFWKMVSSTQIFGLLGIVKVKISIFKLITLCIKAITMEKILLCKTNQNTYTREIRNILDRLLASRGFWLSQPTFSMKRCLMTFWMTLSYNFFGISHYVIKSLQCYNPPYVMAITNKFYTNLYFLSTNGKISIIIISSKQ